LRRDRPTQQCHRRPLRPEPSELPNCSTPRRWRTQQSRTMQNSRKQWLAAATRSRVGRVGVGGLDAIPPRRVHTNPCPGIGTVILTV
jgi:hypothetical protein